MGGWVRGWVGVSFERCCIQAALAARIHPCTCTTNPLNPTHLIPPPPTLQVQAHVVQSDMDPSRGPMWLEITNGKLSIPPGAENMMSQVLLPFRVSLAGAEGRGRGGWGGVWSGWGGG